MYIHASPSLSLFSLPPSCFLPGLKVDVEKLEQNIPCCKASDALASIILWGGGSGQRCRGDSGASLFSFLGLVDMGSHIRRAHTLAQHTLHTHKNNCGSTGLIPQELKQLKVEVSLWRYLLSLSSRRIPLLFLVLLAGRTTSVFQDPLPQEEDGEDGVWI